MPNFDKPWPLRPLADLCDPLRGITYGILKVGDFVPDGVPVIRGGDIRDNKIQFNNEKRVSVEVSNQFRRTVLRGGELVMNLIAEPGHCALVPDSMTGFNVSRDVAVVALGDEVDHVYVNYFLKSPTAVSWLLSRLQGSVTLKINLGTLREVPVAVPPIGYQKAIAEVLGALDEKIAVNDRIVESSYGLVQALWTKSALGARNFVPVSQVAEVDKGLSYKGSGLGGSVPLINLGNFSTDGQFKGSALKYYDGESKDRHWVSRGDLLMANTDLTQRREILGQPALAMTGAERALFTHHVFAIRPHAGVEDDLLWLYGAFRDPVFRERAITYATGTTVVALPRDAVLTYDVPWPGKEIRRDWSDKAQALIDDAAARSGENRTLSQLRDALLPGLMSGSIRVRDAENAVEDAT